MDYKQLLFSMQGRLNREPYWLAAVGLGLVEFILVFVAVALFGQQAILTSVVSIIIELLALWINACLMGKRYHDRGKSAWWLLLALVPFANIWVIIEVGFLRGIVGNNQYGPDPLAEITHPHFGA